MTFKKRHIVSDEIRKKISEKNKGHIPWNKGTHIRNTKINYRGTPEERFWKCIKKGKTENDCWEWVGSLDTRGYGRIKINGKQMSTHRFSYELHKGEIPKGLFVCHSCDNPPCCNPKHLFLGTHKENMRDRDKKERCARQKLTWKKVAKLRFLSSTGKYSRKKLASIFKTTETNIYLIIKNKTWKN